jgi:hypothetical protein
MMMTGANSLYESAVGAGDLALIDRTFAAAEGDPNVATPKAGYVYTVLTGQTAAAGVSRWYLAGGNMTLGYGCGSTPGAYDSTGRNSFIINGAGTIFQRDRGAAASLVHEAAFDPDPLTWTVTE